jgi:NuA3 HAT complex component NTO1
MTTVNITPKRSTQRRPGRPKVSPATEPPHKKRRYVPGGPGGGGRYVDDDGNETPVGGTGPGGYAYSGTRRSAGRNATGSPSAARSPPITTARSRPRRNESSTQPRYSSAAAAASAMSQNEGYKPREERSWEEFHPDLDIEAEFPVFAADDVDNASRDSNPVTPYRGLALHNRSLAENGAVSHVDDALRAQQYTPGQEPSQERDLSNTLSPAKRRVGRPPKQSMLSGLGSPPAPRIVPLPTHNPKERLNLPKPNYRRVETFLPFEEAEDVGVNFVDKSLANVGYQETDRFYRAVETYIRGGEGSIEEELDLTQLSRPGDEGASNSAVVGRVEYDMDEQDLRWLEGINAERKAEQVDAIKPAFFEITMTQIEKEWHALEKSKLELMLTNT